MKLEEPRHTSYRGIEVYKLDRWTQGPSMLQALNILENFDLKSMGYNSASYIHTVYQALSLAFADRDFYYGDPAFPPEEPIKGLLSKDYAKQRAALGIQRPQPTTQSGPAIDPFHGGTTRTRTCWPPRTSFRLHAARFAAHRSARSLYRGRFRDRRTGRRLVR